MGYCYRYVTVEGKGARAESYALLDLSSPLSALSEEFARQMKAPWTGKAKARVGEVTASGWTTRCAVSFNRTDVRIPDVGFVVLPRRVVEDDVSLGAPVVRAVGEEKLAAVRYRCDKCRESLSACEHARRAVLVL